MLPNYILFTHPHTQSYTNVGDHCHAMQPNWEPFRVQCLARWQLEPGFKPPTLQSMDDPPCPWTHKGDIIIMLHSTEGVQNTVASIQNDVGWNVRPCWFIQQVKPSAWHLPPPLRVTCQLCSSWGKWAPSGLRRCKTVANAHRHWVALILQDSLCCRVSRGSCSWPEWVEDL